MTLLLRRPERATDYRAKGSMLRLTTHGLTETRRGFEVEATGWKGQSQSNPVPFVEREGLDDGDFPVSRAKYSSLRGRAPLLNMNNQGSETDSTTTSTPQTSSEGSQAPIHDDIDSTSRHADNRPTIPFDKPGDISMNKSHGDPKQSHISSNGQSQKESDSVIYHLIVTVKTPHTVKAIRPYAHRLTPQSTVLFVQNGMGMIDDVNREIFPSEEDRPHYMVGVLSHGLYSKGPFDVIHAGDGTIALGLTAEVKPLPASAAFLLRTITRTPVFVAVGFNSTEIFQQQLDKLAVNAVINPLTALLDCLNDELLNSFYVTRVMRLLLAEVSSVFRSLPELKNVLNVSMRFDTARLESMVVRVAKLTGRNRSSMLQDVRAGRQTEIDYINGYIIKRGEELGIHCVTNYAIMQIIKAKLKMIQLELDGTAMLQPSVRRK